MDEWELLQRFARDGSQEAFAELVSRHLDFVYSSARRQVRSPHAAQEIAQTVFLELARHAAQLQPGTPLTAWLYVVTRRAALNALRADRRRQAREQAAFELSTMNSVSSVWAQLEPLLDEALDTLNPHDRCALLLRYFENKPLREVGAAMGSSEDAAQKRVGRALDHLRKFFARQGVAISAAGLATHLSAHAIKAAPAALGGLIAATTGSLAPTAPLLAGEAARTLAMTTLQKTLLISAVVVLGAGLYEVRALASQRDNLRALEQEATGLAAREHAARQERDDALRRLAAFKSEAAQNSPATPAPATGDPAIAEILSRVDRMRQRLDTNPHLKIPELTLLKDSDWLLIARERALGSENDLRASLGRLRTIAKNHFTRPLTKALSAYVSANEGRMPATTDDLRPHITEPIEAAALGAMLGRYEIPLRGSIRDVLHDADLILEREQAVVDRDYDGRYRIKRIVSRADTDPFKINFSMGVVPGPLAPSPPRFLR
jgi:RNA polymerase sigma factor (sigma-70 family)